MRNTILKTAIIAFLASVAFASCTDSSASEKKGPAMTEKQMVQRGEYLVNSIGCDDCHSPKKLTPTGFEIIPELRLSGYQSANPSPKADTNVVKQGWLLFGSDLTTAVGPWGQSFTANLTS